MKKKLFIALLATTALTGCSSRPNINLRQTDLKIAAPTGAPSIAMYGFANGLTSVNPPIPEFQKGTYDVIVAPTDGGLNQIINNSAHYKIAATVSFGNFFLLSTGNDDDGVLNAGDDVLYFQPSAVPGKVFNYLYGDLELNTYSVDNFNKTSPVILNNGVYKVDETTTVNLDYIFTAEPIVTNTNSVSKIYHRAREQFSTKSSGKRIMQASVFVNNNTSSEKINEFLTLLKQDIKAALDNPQAIADIFNVYGNADEQIQLFGYNASTVVGAQNNGNGLGLGFLNAYEYKSDIQSFINLVSPALGEIGEEVFYK